MVINIATILNQWAGWGVFDYILPFLLIFAVVFGILSSTNILGKEKGVHVIVAIVIGLLALQLDFMRVFFTELFPRMGVGLAVLIALLILTGLFIPQDARWPAYIFMAIGAVIWILAISGAFEATGWWGRYGYSFSDDTVSMIIGAVLLVGVIIAVVMSKTETKSEGKFVRLKWE